MGVTGRNWLFLPPLAEPWQTLRMFRVDQLWFSCPLCSHWVYFLFFCSFWKMALKPVSEKWLFHVIQGCFKNLLLLIVICNNSLNIRNKIFRGQNSLPLSHLGLMILFHKRMKWNLGELSAEREKWKVGLKSKHLGSSLSRSRTRGAT